MKDITLTKAEEQIMQILWKLKKGFVNDVLEEISVTPKPLYTTVSTIIRILEKKGFVGYKAYGKTHEYFPIVSKKEYAKASTDKLLKSYFEGSYGNMLSFFVKEKKLKLEELDEILKMLGNSDKK